jgi:hypothetical protein
MTNDDPRRRWRELLPDEPATSKFAAPNEPSADKHADYPDKHADYLGQAAEHFGHTPRGQTPAEHHTPPRNAHDPTERTRSENPAGSRRAAAGTGVTQRIPQAAASPTGPYPTPQIPRIARSGQTPSDAAANRKMPANPEVHPPYPPIARAVPTEDTGPIQTPGGRPVAWSNPPAPPRPMPAEHRIHPGARQPIPGRPPTIGPSQTPAPSAAVVLTATGLIVAFAALAFWWLFLPRFFLALYVVAALAAGIGYLVYRSQNPVGAKQLESKVTAELTTVAVQLIALWHTVTANRQSLNTGHGGPHQRTAAPYTPLPAAGTPPASTSGPQRGFVPQAPYTSGSRPNQGSGANAAAVSALLIIPSLIAYGIRRATSRSSAT